MDLFDDTIIEIRDWFEAKGISDLSRSYFISPSPDMPFSGKDLSIGEKMGRIVLKEDTQVELGHPSQGSCSATLATHRSDLVSDGCIHLVGPEISETREPVLPFAQIIIAALKSPNEIEAPSQATLEIENAASTMDRLAHRYAQTDGYMIRSVPNLIWARVSKEACRSGFSLRELGERLINSIKQQCNPVTACEVFFVTRSKKEVVELDDLIEKARIKHKKLETYAVGSDGTFECTQELDCNSCSEQVVCDTIRDVIRIRKGDRVVTFGEEENRGPGPE
jgi:CO dehydrogenase/acetyl-CoA synthase beta subunit